MKKSSEQFLKDLVNATSPSGFEQPAAKVWREYMKDYADEVYGDLLGNSIAILNPKAKFRFLIDGHIDEIGLMVTYIDENGFVYVAQIGGWDPSVLVGQRVKIMGREGDVPGVIGRKPAHQLDADDRAKNLRITDLWVDIGAADREDAQKVVAVGDPIALDSYYEKLRGGKFCARGCDDKIGAWVAAEVIRALSKKKINVCVMSVASVMEEVAGTGAKVSSYDLKPDAAIAIEVGFASDYPGMDAKRGGEAKVGKGPILYRGSQINPILGAGLIETAKKLKIPYQIQGYPRPGGTNLRDIQMSRGGVATAHVDAANRYMHTPGEVISQTDLDNAVKIIAAYLEKHPAKKDYTP
jgi:tetrahedral aminopeptidase